MRFRPANIRLINRRSNLPRLLLALSSINGKSNNNDKNNPTDVQELTGSLHIRALYPPLADLVLEAVKSPQFGRRGKGTKDHFVSTTNSAATNHGSSQLGPAARCHQHPERKSSPVHPCGSGYLSRADISLEILEWKPSLP